MDFDALIQQAKEKERADSAQKNAPFYLKTIAWFCYLGLLRHSKIQPRRHVITIDEALRAGALEPRILELLPAILIVVPKALKFSEDAIPDDLKTIVQDIRKRRAEKNFRGIPPDKYLHWLRAPVMDIAKRRLDFHRVPRRRMKRTHAIGEIIRNGRLNLALTQEQLAKKYDLSLRIIRDLEQGKMDASLKATNEILAVFGRSLNA